MILSPMILLSPTSLPVGLGLSATAMGFITAVGALVGFAVGVVFFILYSLIIFVGYDSVPMMLLAVVVSSVATAFCYTAFPKLIESVPADVTSETTDVMVTARQALSAVGVAVASVILSSSTIPETTVPTVGAIRGCLFFFIACSLLALVACVATGRRRSANRIARQVESVTNRVA